MAVCKRVLFDSRVSTGKVKARKPMMGGPSTWFFMGHGEVGQCIGLRRRRLVIEVKIQLLMARFVGKFSSKGGNGLWVLVLWGVRHANY